MVRNLGYGRRDLVEAAYQQMQELPYYNSFFQTANIPAIQLSQALSEVTPDGWTFLFRQFRLRGDRHGGARGAPLLIDRRPERTFISRQNAYHGSTVAGVSLGGMGFMHDQGGPLLGDVAHIAQPCGMARAATTPDAFGLAVAGALSKKSSNWE